MKRFLGVFLAMVMVLCMTACGNDDGKSSSSTPSSGAEKSEQPSGGGDASDEKPVEITFATWAMESEMTKMVDLYNSSQSKVHVTLQVTPLSEYGTLMNAVLGTSEGPDVLWAGLQTRLWGNAGKLAELQERAAQDNLDFGVFLEYPLDRKSVG